MMPEELAAIVARDAGADMAAAGPGNLTWDRLFRAEDDRRALLALLAEVRGRLGPSHPHDPAPAICGACDVWNKLAALGEP